MSNQDISTKNKLDGGLLFKISRFREEIKKTTPHKHDDYFELIFLSDGQGFHWIETEGFTVSPPEFYFLKPGQLHFWQFTSVPKGFVILFNASFFDDMKEPDLVNLYRQLGGKTRIPVSGSFNPESVLSDLFDEFSAASDYSVHIIHGYLRVLFARLLQLAEIHSKASDLPATLFERFQSLLLKESPALHKVNDYARMLNTTPRVLNAVCKKHSGKSAHEHIVSQLLLEAKRYILYTENTVNEIAYLLSFNDSSNFVKFFRKNEKLTPIQFREKHFNNTA